MEQELRFNKSHVLNNCSAEDSANHTKQVFSGNKETQVTLLQLLSEILKDKSQVAELNNWVERLSDENKKGLRVIQKVLEVDGKKKFKKDTETTQNKELLIKDVFSIPYE